MDFPLICVYLCTLVDVINQRMMRLYWHIETFFFIKILIRLHIIFRASLLALICVYLCVSVDKTAFC